jgi:hypothetical protein
MRQYAACACHPLAYAGHAVPRGQVITLTGVATDTQDGVLPDSALSWRVVLHHIDQTHPENAHTHPYLPPTPGNHIAFVAPPPEDLDATALSHLEIQLTATDAWGASTTLTQTLEPQRVNVTFASQPDGLRLTVNSVPLTATQSITLGELCTQMWLRSIPNLWERSRGGCSITGRMRRQRRTPSPHRHPISPTR